MQGNEGYTTGRPKDNISLYDKYVKGNEDVVIAACREGAVNETLARLLGIGISTFKKIRKESDKLKKLMKEGKEVADMKVESALYKRAIGYDVEETVTEVKVNPDGDCNTTIVKKVKKHIPGDTTAQIFWLKNRRPDRWTEKAATDDSWVEALAAITQSYKKESKEE